MSTIEQEILARDNLVQLVRRRMRDYPELNTTIEGVENDDIFIEDAIDYVMSYVTEVPPYLGVLSISQIPEYLLLDGVVAELGNQQIPGAKAPASCKDEP